MATISIDYDSRGDVELILQEKEYVGLDQAADQASQSSEEGTAAMYTVGLLGVKVKEVHLRVSSLRLISSSRYFQAMLEGGRFPEGNKLKEDGFIQIRLTEPEDEPTVMIIILGILYEKDVQLPTKIDLPMLHKVAVLVDKYQWHVPLTPYAVLWFEDLANNEGFPKSFDESTLMWLWIAWLFGMKNHFKSLSRIAQQDARNTIDPTEEGIRLPTRIIEAINKQREVAFRKVEQATRTVRERLLVPDKNETVPERTLVRAMAFGFVTFCSQDLQLREYGTSDHTGCSIRWLRDRINLLQSTQGFTVCPPNLHTSGRYIIQGGPWDLKNTLQTVMSDLNIDDWGLNYDDFKPSFGANRLDKIPALE